MGVQITPATIPMTAASTMYLKTINETPKVK